MAEIDQVVLELVANNRAYLASVRDTTTTVDRMLGRQEASARKLEAEMRRSSGAIAGTIKGLAATFATAFTGRELVGMLDSFTRFENALKVAGLEGANLIAVQEQLFASAQRNGVSLEAVGTLYGRAAQSAKELGASTADLLNFTNAVSASLKITGTTTEQASGALLQLGQALGSPRVQAEEFNSLIDTMRPLLVEAAKHIDGTGGSLAGLIQKLKDTKGPGLSNIELFRGVTAAMADLEKKADETALTLSAGFTTISNALTRYFGEADKANGVSVALGQTLQALANNLDTIIPALAAIATGLGVGFVTNAARASIAAAGVGLAARGMGAALLGALGGPIGIAITALVLGLGYLATENAKASTAAKELANQSTRTKSAIDAEKEATDALAAAKGKDADAALRAVQASRARAAQALQTAKTLKAEAEAELALARARGAQLSAASDKFQGALPAGVGRVAIAGTRENYNERQRLQREIDRQNARIAEAEGKIQGVDAAIAAAQAPVKLAQATAGGKASSGTGSSSNGPTGPSAADIERRFADEITGYTQQTLAARQQLARNADERAELELRSLELARRSTLASIAADEDYSKAQKADLAFQVEQLALREREVIDLRRRVEEERDAQDLADERYQAERDQLGLQYDLADTQEQRRAIAFRILAAEDAYLKSKLEAVIASQTATDAERERARIALAAVNASADQRREVVARAEQGPLGRYAQSAKDANARVEEAAARRIAELNDTIADAMTNALGIEDPFLRDLISIFLDKNIFGPLAEGLSKGGGTGGLLSAIGNAIGAIFGGGGPTNLLEGTPYRAGGGRVSAGTLYRVNEGASPGRVEGFMPDVGGRIIPLGRMNAVRGGGEAGIATVRVELSGDIDARIARVSGPVAVEVVQASAPMVIDAAANETLRRASRPGL